MSTTFPHVGMTVQRRLMDREYQFFADPKGGTIDLIAAAKLPDADEQPHLVRR